MLYATPPISLSSNEAQRTPQTTRYVIGKQFSREISFIHACVWDTRPGYGRKVRRTRQRMKTKKKCHREKKQRRKIPSFLLFWVFGAESRALGTHTHTQSNPMAYQDQGGAHGAGSWMRRTDARNDETKLWEILCNSNEMRQTSSFDCTFAHSSGCSLSPWLSHSPFHCDRDTRQHLILIDLLCWYRPIWIIMAFRHFLLLNLNFFRFSCLRIHALFALLMDLRACDRRNYSNKLDKVSYFYRRRIRRIVLVCNRAH